MTPVEIGLAVLAVVGSTASIVGLVVAWRSRWRQGKGVDESDTPKPDDQSHVELEALPDGGFEVTNPRQNGVTIRIASSRGEGPRRSRRS